MGLRFDPIGGGQFKAAVKQIMEAESRPIRLLEAQKARQEARMKLFEQFKTKVSDLQKSLGEISTFQKFREFKVDMGDGANLAEVTVDKEKAQPGSYALTIDQLAQRTSAISNGFENPDAPVIGMGYIATHETNGKDGEIFVDSEHSSLHGIANLINQTADFPVRAAVIKDASDSDTPWKLILTAKKEGQANEVNFPNFYFLDGEKEFYMDDDRDAKNAKIEMDGFPIEAESNNLPDFLPGVNLHLKQANPGHPFTFTISEDHKKIAGKMKALVDQLNTVFSFITKQNAVDEHSDTTTTFAGDTGLQSIEYRLRNLLQEGFPVGDPNSPGFHRLFFNQMGIEFEKTGQLKFSEDKFSNALEKNFDTISQGLTGPYGFSYQLRTVLDGYTRPLNGLLTIREQGMRHNIQDIDRQIDDKSRMLDRRQQELTQKFARLEGSLADLQRQQQYLSSTLPTAGGNNLVAQLLGG